MLASHVSDIRNRTISVQIVLRNLTLGQATVSPARSVRTSAQAPVCPAECRLGACTAIAQLAQWDMDWSCRKQPCAESACGSLNKEESKHRVGQAVLIALCITSSARASSTLAFVSLVAYKLLEFTLSYTPFDLEDQAFGVGVTAPDQEEDTSNQTNQKAQGGTPESVHTELKH